MPRPIEPVVHDILVADKPWHLVVSPSVQPPMFGLYGSVYVLIGGILFSLLAAAYVHALGTREQRVRLPGAGAHPRGGTGQPDAAGGYRRARTRWKRP